MAPEGTVRWFVLPGSCGSLCIKDARLAKVGRNRQLGARLAQAKGGKGQDLAVFTQSPSVQRVAHVLWNQLNKETQEHHITCVKAVLPAALPGLHGQRLRGHHLPRLPEPPTR